MNRYEFESHKFGNVVITLKAVHWIAAEQELRKKLKEAHRLGINLGITSDYRVANCTILYTKEGV